MTEIETCFVHRLFHVLKRIQLNINIFKIFVICMVALHRGRIIPDNLMARLNEQNQSII